MTTVIGVLLTALAVLGGVSMIPAIRRKRIAAVAIGAVNLTISALALLLATLTPPLDASMLPWLAAMALLAATLSGSSVVNLMLAAISRFTPPPPEAERDAQAPLPMTAWIGAVERFGFTLALLIGLPTVAAILIGVKALGSYAAKDNHLPALRVLGTLASVSWALVIYAVIALGYPGALSING